MEKWQYKWVQGSGGDVPGEHTLDLFGSEGWEAVGVVYINNHDARQSVRVLLKRRDR